MSWEILMLFALYSNHYTSFILICELCAFAVRLLVETNGFMRVVADRKMSRFQPGGLSSSEFESLSQGQTYLSTYLPIYSQVKKNLYTYISQLEKSRQPCNWLSSFYRQKRRKAAENDVKWPNQPEIKEKKSPKWQVQFFGCRRF